MGLLQFFYSIKFFIILWFIIVYLLYLKWDKENKLAYKEKYYTGLPGCLSPAEMKALISYGRLYPCDMVAQAAQLILNDVLIVSLEKKNKLKLSLSPEAEHNLSAADSLLLNMLLSVSNNKKEITIQGLLKPRHKTLKKISLRKKFKLWQKEINLALKAQNIYSSNKTPKALGIFISLVYTALSVFLSLRFSRPFYLVLVVFAVILFIYSINILKRSPEGQKQYARWMSFKRYVKDINKPENRFEKTPFDAEKAERCIPYAISLGVYPQLIDYIEAHKEEGNLTRLKILKTISGDELKTIIRQLIKAAELSLISVEYE